MKHRLWNPHPVAEKTPNAWGLYDMLGNVREWCSDWYGDYPSNAVTDSTGPSSEWFRVLRGGGWNNPADGGTRNCRSAYRYYDYPASHYDNFGFRLLRRP